MTEKKLHSRVIMQVHDELVFEIHEDEKSVMEDMIRDKNGKCN